MVRWVMLVTSVATMDSLATRPNWFLAESRHPMGDLEFIFNNNQAISIGHFDFCDKCLKYVSIEGGETQTQDGLQLMWFCSECR